MKYIFQGLFWFIGIVLFLTYAILINLCTLIWEFKFCDTATFIGVPIKVWDFVKRNASGVYILTCFVFFIIILIYGAYHTTI